MMPMIVIIILVVNVILASDTSDKAESGHFLDFAYQTCSMWRAYAKGEYARSQEGAISDADIDRICCLVHTEEVRPIFNGTDVGTAELFVSKRVYYSIGSEKQFISCNTLLMIDMFLKRDTKYQAIHCKARLPGRDFSDYGVEYHEDGHCFSRSKYMHQCIENQDDAAFVGMPFLDNLHPGKDHFATFYSKGPNEKRDFRCFRMEVMNMHSAVKRWWTTISHGHFENLKKSAVCPSEDEGNEGIVPSTLIDNDVKLPEMASEGSPESSWGAMMVYYIITTCCGMVMWWSAKRQPSVNEQAVVWWEEHTYTLRRVKKTCRAGWYRCKITEINTSRKGNEVQVRYGDEDTTARHCITTIKGRWHWKYLLDRPE